MFRGDWRKHAPLALGVFFAAVSAVLVYWWIKADFAEHAVRNEKTAERYEQRAKEHLNRVCARLPADKFLGCSREQEAAYQQIQRAYADLEAQESMSTSTRWMLIAAVASLYVTGTGLWLVFRTLQETKDATEAIVQAERPWVSLENATMVGPAQIEDGVIEIQLSILARNFGNTPAIAARCACGTAVGTASVLDFKHKAAIADAEKHVAAFSTREQADRLANTIFPNDGETLKVCARIKIEELRKHESSIVTIAAVIGYGYGSRFGFTTKCFYVRGQPDESLILDTQAVIARPGMLRLAHHPLGSTAT